MAVSKSSPSLSTTKPLRNSQVRRLMLAAAAAVSSSPTQVWADNPIVQTLYTADPAPLVHEGTLYLYTTHDEDVTVNNFFTMNDWRVYSTTDVVNWTDHGSPLHYQDFSWAGGSAWAGQVIFRNDKFYFYVPVARNNGGSVIGVAVSDSPTGPFVDPIDAPLVTSDCGDIDPTVFIDDDGQAYLYWGNPNLCYVKLNEDMTSYQGGVVKVQMNTGSFGVRANNDRPTSYEEGPWFYRRDGRYYLVYPGGPLPEHIAYSTSTSPTGPWTYKSVIMPAEGSSFTNHPGVVDFGGKSLFFYHNGALPGGGGYKRSVAVEEFVYGADGSIPQLRMTTEGAGAVATLNPFRQVEAETMAWSVGVETEVCSEGGMNLTALDNGDYVKLKEVDFAEGATTFEVRVAGNGGTIELHLDSLDGPLIGSCAVTATGGAQTWATQTCNVEGAQGKHDLFLRFVTGGYKFNWWKFSGPGELGEETGADTQTGSETVGVSSDESAPDSTSAATETENASTTSTATSSGSTSTPTTSAPPPATSTGGSTSTSSTPPTSTAIVPPVAPSTSASTDTSTSSAPPVAGAGPSSTSSSCEFVGSRTSSNNTAGVLALGLFAMAMTVRRTSRASRRQLP